LYVDGLTINNITNNAINSFEEKSALSLNLRKTLRATIIMIEAKFFTVGTYLYKYNLTVLFVSP